MADAENLYPIWVTSPKQVLSRLETAEPFTPSEVDAAAVWSRRQEPWGLRAQVHANRLGAAAVLEVFGPDDLVPHCIIHQAEGGLQSDEYDGSSKVFPCLEAALCEIAPLN